MTRVPVNPVNWLNICGTNRLVDWSIGVLSALHGDKINLSQYTVYASKI